MENLKMNMEIDKKIIVELEKKNQELTKNLIQSSSKVEQLEHILDDLRREKDDTEHQLR